MRWKNSRLRPLSVAFVLLIAFCNGVFSAAFCRVTEMRLPGDGIEPQAIVDKHGSMHVIYFSGDAMRGDLYYMTRSSGSDHFSQPIRINSIRRSAIATGTIRGAQLSLGRDGRVFVVWNGSDQVGNAVLVSRLNDAKTHFNEQRNLVHQPVMIDGGSTIASDNKGNVYVFWHAVLTGKDEASGRIYMSVSRNDGRTFEPEKAIDTPSRGTCGCCSMKASTDDSGRVYVMYRSADHNSERDAVLLTSSDQGRTFLSTNVARWHLMACPMTIFALTPLYQGVMAGWESQGSVHFAPFPASKFDPYTPSSNELKKYPTIAVNAAGDVLYSWTEGTGWDKGGVACWQTYEKAARRLSPIERRTGMKKWSFTAAVAQPSGSFVVLY